MHAEPNSTIRASDVSAKTVFDHYHAAWESMDPDRIAALHSDDTTFWLQDGSARITGRDAVRKNIAGLAATFGRLGWDIQRVMFGERHWVFEYNMLIDLTDRQGQSFTAKVGMVDIVDFNDDGEITRKDVFIDAAARTEALTRAGMI